MRRLVLSTAFRRDLKRTARSGVPFEEIEPVLHLLRGDIQLPAHMRDHALSGPWKTVGARECHVKPDLLLVYSKPEGELYLLRIGTHSELF